MYTILSVNDSRICRYISPSIWTSEYYNYCVRLLEIALQSVQQPVNVILGDIACDFKNANRTIKIDIQSEHTLVKLGGRSVDEIVYGNIDVLGGEGKYLIRIPNYDYYSKLDATIEYSMPNIINMRTNDRFSDYLRKAIYIAPVIYDAPDFQARERAATITLLSGNHSDRRIQFFGRAAQKEVEVVNVHGAFTRDALKSIYNTTKIMVNLHQTDHHHTFEELRVLPALCNGVVIVSEDVPLRETIPYADAIVWSSYDDLADTVQYVQRNHDLFKQVFTPKLERRLMQLHENNIQNLVNYLTNL